MEKNVKFILVVLSIAFISSCSQFATKDSENNAEKVSERDLTPEEVKKISEENIRKVSERLKVLSIAAKASGKDSIRYLASDMYLKASAAHLEGDYLTANIIFARLIELVPDDYYLKRKYAVSLIRMGELEKSLVFLKDVFEHTGKKDSNIGLILAGVYTSLGQNKKSKKIYRGLIANDKKDVDACVFLSKTYALEDNYKRAIKTLKTCEKNNPKSGVYSFYLGKIYVDKNKLKKAATFFKRSVKIQPNYGQSTMALGLIYEELGKSNKAIKIYKRYLKRNPKDTLVLNRIVQALFATEQFDKVIPYAERLSDFEPENLNLKVKLGILYTDAHKYQEAISVFKNLLHYAPKSDKILYYLGAIYQEIKEYDKAIDYFYSISDESGLYQDSSIQVAHMLSSLAKIDFIDKEQKGQKHDRFIEFVDNKISELNKLKVEFSVIKAGYFETIEDTEYAIQALEIVSDDASFTNNHRYYMASLYEKELKFDESTSLIMEIIEKDPTNPHAWNFLGYSLVERNKDLELAYEYIKKAVELSPNDGYIRDTLGWYYYKKGYLKKALVELSIAVKKIPKDMSIQKHLAIIHFDLNQYDLAKSYVIKALKNTTLESERKDLYKVLKKIDSKRIPASKK